VTLNELLSPTMSGTHGDFFISRSKNFPFLRRALDVRYYPHTHQAKINKTTTKHLLYPLITQQLLDSNRKYLLVVIKRSCLIFWFYFLGRNNLWLVSKILWFVQKICSVRIITYTGRRDIVVFKVAAKLL
jgi:hypothetical protein